LPPLSQIVNRRTSQKVRLGNDIILHEGTYVGYYSYATNRSRQAWGEDADEFRPERWGSTTDDIRNRFRRANTRAEFISFHGGRRACLGQKFSMLQMRVTLFEVIKALRWSLDPTWAERMTPGGPLSPRMLRLKFEEV
ncbi:hypothetical protein MMC06_005229, partial [Schaereria dolodes]|nr:hypothetical protein [Schaereria dolodes]